MVELVAVGLSAACGVGWAVGVLEEREDKHAVGGAGEEGEGEAVRVVVVVAVIPHCVDVSDEALHLSVVDFCVVPVAIAWLPLAFPERLCGESVSDF